MAAGGDLLKGSASDDVQVKSHRCTGQETGPQPAQLSSTTPYQALYIRALRQAFSH